MGLFEYDEPLGMPKGSVRAIITILIVFAILILVILQQIYGAQVDIPDWLIAIVSSVIAYYFGSKKS